MTVESILSPDENLYRIEWVSCTYRLTKTQSRPLTLFPLYQVANSQVLSIQLLGKGDFTLDEANLSPERLYQSWIASYALTSPSETVGAQVKAPLLRRNRSHVSEEEETDDPVISRGLQVRVRTGRYRLSFVPKSEDYFYRRRPEHASPSTKWNDPTDAREDGEVNGGGEESGSTLAGQSEREGDVSIRRRRKDRFEQWLDGRTGFGRMTAPAGLAASLPPLPLPPVITALPPPTIPAIPTPVADEAEEGEVVDVEMSIA